MAWRGLKLVVPQPGAHNALNALAAAELCAQLGYAPERIARRWRVSGASSGGWSAWTPAAGCAWWTIRAQSGQAGRGVDRRGRARQPRAGVWRPHGYGPLRAMLDPLAAAFASVCRPQDKLWLLPVYDAGGTTDRSIQSDALAAKLRVRGGAAELAANYDDLGAALAGAARAGDVILTMGARDPRLPAFAREMAAKTADR